MDRLPFGGVLFLAHIFSVEVVQWLRDEVLAEDSDGRAVDLAWDFVTWADGDTEREKVFNLFQDDPNSSSDPFGE